MAENDKVDVSEKRAPVQGYAAGIPWHMHLRAYDVYAKRHGPHEAMIDLDGRGCRGGFSVDELDMFIPGWRQELDELTLLRAQLAAAQSDLQREREDAARYLSSWINAERIHAFSTWAEERAEMICDLQNRYAAIAVKQGAETPPYPFCLHPGKCTKGRCTNDPVCNN